MSASKIAPICNVKKKGMKRSRRSHYLTLPNSRIYVFSLRITANRSISSSVSVCIAGEAAAPQATHHANFPSSPSLFVKSTIASFPASNFKGSIFKNSSNRPLRISSAAAAAPAPQATHQSFVLFR